MTASSFCHIIIQKIYPSFTLMSGLGPDHADICGFAHFFGFLNNKHHETTALLPDQYIACEGKWIQKRTPRTRSIFWIYVALFKSAWCSWAKQKQQAEGLSLRLTPVSPSVGHFLSPSACHVGTAVFLNLVFFCWCDCSRRAEAARFSPVPFPGAFWFHLTSRCRWSSMDLCRLGH